MLLGKLPLRSVSHLFIFCNSMLRRYPPTPIPPDPHLRMTNRGITASGKTPNLYWKMAAYGDQWGFFSPLIYRLYLLPSDVFGGAREKMKPTRQSIRPTVKWLISGLSQENTHPHTRQLIRAHTTDSIICKGPHILLFFYEDTNNVAIVD